MRFTHILPAVMLAGLAALSPPALAQPRTSYTGQTRATAVAFGDLNLATQAGDQALVGRITRAAARDCRDLYAGDTADEAEAYHQCRSSAAKAAVEKVGSPAVTRLYAAETGGRAPAR